jgi:hypothetical protein
MTATDGFPTRRSGVTPSDVSGTGSGERLPPSAWVRRSDTISYLDPDRARATTSSQPGHKGRLPPRIAQSRGCRPPAAASRWAYKSKMSSRDALIHGNVALELANGAPKVGICRFPRASALGIKAGNVSYTGRYGGKCQWSPARRSGDRDSSTRSGNRPPQVVATLTLHRPRAAGALFGQQNRGHVRAAGSSRAPMASHGEDNRWRSAGRRRRRLRRARCTVDGRRGRGGVRASASDPEGASRGGINAG